MMHAADLQSSQRLNRVYRLLSTGFEWSTLEIARRAKVCAVNSCISELRANGIEIACRRTTDRKGDRIWLYQLKT